VDAFAATGREGLRRALASVPAGRHAAEAAPLPLAVCVADGRVHLDFTQAGEAAAALGAVTSAMAGAACRVALRQLFAGEVPTLGYGGGWDRELLELDAPWCVASPDVAVGTGRRHLVHAILESVLAAFSPFYPHLGKAPGPLTPVLLELRGRDGAGRSYALRILVGCGAGGSVLGDGLAHTGPPTGAARLLPVERLEERFPIFVHTFGLREGSAGPGRYRGGLGAVLDFELTEGQAEMNAVLPGRAPGIRGGYAGAGARLAVQGPERGLRAWAGPGRHALPLRKGERVRVETAGGGGWGLPYQRPIHKVEEDVRRGLVRLPEAKNPYGVIVNPATLEKDDVLTYRVRHYLLTSLVVEDIVAGQDATIWG
jgi:N-methylhydantoinase B